MTNYIKQIYNNIRREVVDEWQDHRLQVMGAVMLIAALVCCYLTGYLTVYTPLVIYALVLLDDLLIYLIARAKGVKGEMVTHWVRRQFPGYGDIVILLVLVAITWIIAGPLFAVFEIRGITQGHLHWDN